MEIKKEKWEKPEIIVEEIKNTLNGGSGAFDGGAGSS